MSIYLYAVMTLDGKIALNSSDPIQWSSAEDKEFVKQEAQGFELAFVGRKTYEIASMFLENKINVVFTRAVSELTQISEVLFHAPLEGFDAPAFMRAHGISRATVLGGSYIYSYFVQQDWVDHIYLTLEPLTFGQGVPWLSERDARRDYRLSDMRRLNDRGTLLLHYERL